MMDPVKFINKVTELCLTTNSLLPVEISEVFDRRGWNIGDYQVTIIPRYHNDNYTELDITHRVRMMENGLYHAL